MFCCIIGSKALDRYIHAVTVCNSLALLVSQGSSRDFAVRIALLTALQKCWLSGHLILNLECSSDGSINCASDVVVHDSDITCDLGIHSAADVEGSLPAEHCDNNIDFEVSADYIALPNSECLNASENAQEKSTFVTDGCELLFSVFCNVITVQVIDSVISNTLFFSTSLQH